MSKVRSHCNYSKPLIPPCRWSSSLSNDKYERYRNLTPESVAKLQLETERTRQSIDQTLKDKVSREILDAASVTAESVPELGPTGRYLYFSQDSTDGHRCYYRRPVDGSRKEDEVVFLLSFYEYQLHAMSLSVEEDYVACLLSTVSDGETQVKLRHLPSGRETVLPTPAGSVVANVEWGPRQEDGSDSLFFTTTNALGRPNAVHACRVYPTSEISPSTCLYQNDNEAVMVDVQRTKGCHYMSISAATKTSSEVFLTNSTTSNSVLVRPRQDGVLYHVDMGDENDVFILANAAEPNHKSGLSEELALFGTTIRALPLQSSFGTVLAQEDDEHIISDMDIFKDFVALYERSTVDGCQRIRLKYRTESKEDIVLPLPRDSGECAMLSPGGNMYYHSKSLCFSVESPCSPGRTYSFDTITSNLRAMGDESKGFPRYEERRVLVPSADGTQVPMSLFYSSDNPIGSGSRPTVLVGYGAYGEPVAKGFDPTIMPLLDRGFVVAFAHTRGGGELGRAWYRAGRLYEKGRAIDDYIACAEALVDSLQISKRQILTAKAFSAGGVTIAGAVNRRPDLFGSVVLTNPFLDVTTSTNNTQLALTEHEQDEWGDPIHDAKAAKSIASYCPVSNVTPQDYPAMLLVGTLDDTNVPVWHPLVFALKVRESLRKFLRVSTENEEESFEKRVLLHVELSGGHQLHGSKLEVAAMECAFIMGCMWNTN